MGQADLISRCEHDVGGFQVVVDDAVLKRGQVAQARQHLRIHVDVYACAHTHTRTHTDRQTDRQTDRADDSKLI